MQFWHEPQAFGRRYAACAHFRPGGPGGGLPLGYVDRLEARIRRGGLVQACANEARLGREKGARSLLIRDRYGQLAVRYPEDIGVCDGLYHHRYRGEQSGKTVRQIEPFTLSVLGQPRPNRRKLSRM